MAPFVLPLFRYIWLPAASFFAGVLNTIAGGGSFLSLPALIASTSVAGVGAVTAQATNTVALWPGQLTSLVAFRRQLRSYGWSLLPLALASGAGGWLGGFLLLRTGNQRFRIMLPWLLLFAAVIFMLSFPLGKWLSTLSDGRRYDKLLLVGMVVVSVYVGYFGAGGGFLVMALFGICGIHNIHEVNALKVVTAAVSIGIPAITFHPRPAGGLAVLPGNGRGGRPGRIPGGALQPSRQPEGDALDRSHDRIRNRRILLPSERRPTPLIVRHALPPRFDPPAEPASLVGANQALKRTAHAGEPAQRLSERAG